MAEEKLTYVQALNSFVSQVKEWDKKYILRAPLSGNIIFSGSIQNHTDVKTGQPVFYVNPRNTDFYGELGIPQYNLGKAKTYDPVSKILLEK